MPDPAPPGLLGTKDPPSRLLVGVQSAFERGLAIANPLKPVLPVEVQKEIELLGLMHANRGVDGGAPATRRDPPTARFRLGPPRAPEFNFDHGFLNREEPDGRNVLDLGRREPPTQADHEVYAKWRAAGLAMLVLRPDLADGVLGYLHYLDGHGAPFRFDYERFLTQDAAGRRVLESALADTKTAIIELGRGLARADQTEWLQRFQMYSDAIVVGGYEGAAEDMHADDRYPYPSTENWAKAIGGHCLWIESSVAMGVDVVRRALSFDAQVVLHAADAYNFDPKKHDLATGLPDAVNGRLQVTGLAQEFLQTGEAQRRLTVDAPAPNLSTGTGGQR